MDRTTIRYYDGIARRLRAASRRDGRSQALIAGLAGISQATLSRFLSRAAISLRTEVLWRIAVEVGLDPGELVKAPSARQPRAGGRS